MEKQPNSNIESSNEHNEQLSKDLEKFRNTLDETINRLDQTRQEGGDTFSHAERSLDDITNRLQYDRRRADMGGRVNTDAYIEEISAIQRQLSRSEENLTSGGQMPKIAENVHIATTEINLTDKDEDVDRSVRTAQELAIDAAARIETVIGRTTEDSNDEIRRAIRILAEAQPGPDLEATLRYTINILSSVMDTLGHGKRQLQGNQEIDESLQMMRRTSNMIREQSGDASPQPPISRAIDQFI